jgi:hypothetical protein
MNTALSKLPMLALMATTACSITACSVSEPAGKAADGATDGARRCAAQWDRVPLTNDPELYWIGGIWGSGPNDVHLVGSNNLIFHFDGSTWSGQKVEKQGVILQGVWGSGPTDVFAVGGMGLVFHYDGKSWRWMHSKAPAALFAVWGSGPKDVFAVGGGFSPPAGQPAVVVHYDGSSWTRMTSNTPPDTTLVSVWGSGPSDVWAGGYAGSSGVGVLMHYDGSTWAQVTIPPFRQRGRCSSAARGRRFSSSRSASGWRLPAPSA